MVSTAESKRRVWALRTAMEVTNWNVLCENSRRNSAASPLVCGFSKILKPFGRDGVSGDDHSVGTFTGDFLCLGFGEFAS
jgi:hypothetical protein